MTFPSWLLDDDRLSTELGEILGGRYRVVETCSSGTFSNAFICLDRETRNTVVVKAYRKQSYYTLSGKREIQVMKLLNQLDPAQQFFVRLLGDFQQRGHVCIVLERYGMSLLDALAARNFESFGLKAIASIILQVAQALNVMHKNGMIHTDIKLENILLPVGFDPIAGFADTRKIDIRLIDFSSIAQTRRWNKYLVTTRAYRAPEIMMGLRWGFECDIWSLGCLFVELIFGKIVFDSKSDIEHLFLIQHMIGPFPKWMVEECVNADVCAGMIGGLIDPSVLDSDVRRMLLQEETLREKLGDNPDLVDLVLKMLEPDPFARISLDELIEHPFFKGF